MIQLNKYCIEKNYSLEINFINKYFDMKNKNCNQIFLIDYKNIYVNKISLKILREKSKKILKKYKYMISKS